MYRFFMMNMSRTILALLLVSVFLAGCGAPALASQPIDQAQTASTPTPTATLANLYVVPSDATPTATPFQPLPPTPYILPTDVPTPTPTPLPTATPERPADSGALRPVGGQPEGQINILLLGADKRPWDSQFRTDTIILATLNPDLGVVNFTSFPRDLYVNIPGRGQSRINTAWTFGGYELLAQTFQANFGVTPDHYVLINFSSFKQIIDGLGGLDVHVAESVSDYRNGYWVTIPAGDVHMDADDVLWYVRTRKTTNDYARNRRQQEVLQALIEKFISMDVIKRAPEFYEIYKNNVTTDIDLGDVIPLLPLAARVAESRSINQYFIGPQQTYDWITWDGAMVLMPQPGAIEKVLRKSLNIP